MNDPKDALRSIVTTCDTALDRIGKGQKNPPMYTVLRAIRDDARKALEGAK